MREWSPHTTNRSAPPAPDALFVLGAPGSAAPRLARALASLRACSALAEEPAPAVEIGTLGDRCTGTAGRAGAARTRSTIPTTPVDGASKRMLQLPHLAQVFGDPRFILCRRSPEEALPLAYDGWLSERQVTHPDLDGWSGPPWSYALVPGWRELNGLGLEEIVAEQWIRVVDTCARDLAELEPERWVETSHEALREDPAAELGRLCERTDVDPTGLSFAARLIATDFASEARTDRVSPELAAELPRVAAAVEQAEASLGLSVRRGE